MRRKLWIAGGALLTLLLAAVFFYLKSQSFMTTAAGVLASEATKALDARVEIASVQVGSLRTATATDVTVYDKQGKLLATAGAVDVEFGLLGMMRGGDPLEQIARVAVRDFAVQVEKRADGAWNYSDFLAEEAEPNAFRGEVVLENGAVTALFSGKCVSAEQVAGRLDFASQPAIDFDLTLAQGGAAARLSGAWGGKRDAVSVKAENFDLERYLEFLPEDMAVKLQRGRIKSVEATLLREAAAYTVNGEALVLGVTLEAGDTQVEGIDGLFLFNEKELRVFSRGKIKGEPVVLRGTTSLDMADPILHLRVSSPGFDAAKVLKKFPLSGKIAFDAGIEGTFSAPVVRGRFDVAAGEIYGQTLRNVKAQLQFADGLLLVEQASGQTLGGRVDAAGQVDADAARYRLRVRASGLDAAALAAYVGDAAGAIDADVEVSGQGWDFAGATVFGSVSATDGQLRQLAFRRADASFYKAGDEVRLDDLLLQLPQGTLQAEGVIGAQALRLQVRGVNVDLAQAAQLNPQLQLSGLADFSAAVTGTPSAPAATAQFTAASGAFFQQPYQRARGKVRLADQQLSLESFAMEDGPASHEAHGFLRLDGAHELRLEIVSRQVRVENIMRLVLPEEQLTGNVDNAVTIMGTPDALRAEGEMRFREGSFRGVLLKEAAGKYRYDSEGLILQDFVVSSPNLRMQLSGALRAGEDLDFDFAADDIQIGKLRLKLPYPVSGTARFAGKLRGKVSSPVFEGKLAADSLVFNGQEVREIDGELLYKENVVELTGLAFKQGEGSFRMTAGADLATERLYGKLEVACGDLSAILALFNLETDWIGGTLDGAVTLGGTAKAPQVGLTGSMAQGHLKQYPLKNIALDIRLDGTLATIRQFRAQQGEGLLVAKGSIDFAGPLDVEIAGQNIEAGLLTNLAAFDLETKGLLNFGAQIGGSVQNPRGNASITVEGGGVGTATFDTLYGMFKLEDGIIGIDQFLVQKGEYKASAYGIIPVAALTKSADENASIKDQMDLRISLDQANLSILPFLTKEIEWAAGDTQGGVSITGTLARPLVKGRVAIEGGAVKFKALGHPVERMRLDLVFDGDRMALHTFEGAMGRGDYKLSGEARLTGDGFEDYAFALDLRQLDVVNAYYTGPLDGQLTLTSDTLRKRPIPKLAGLLHFRDTTFDIPPIPEGETALPDMKLDVAVTLGKKVRLYNSFLYDIWLDGHVNFGGTTRYPKTTGEIEAIRGTVQYLKTPFKIKEAAAYFNQVSSFLPSLRLEADTRMDRTKVYLNVDGPVETMTVKLRSDPEMNESEILSLLTLRSRYKDRDGGDLGRDELVSLLDVGLRMSFLSELESMMRGALGVDEFRVVRDTLVLSDESANSFNREVYNIEIGKYVSDKLMLRYTTGVDGGTYKFGVQYDFNNRISLTSSLDQDNEPAIGIEARFKF